MLLQKEKRREQQKKRLAPFSVLTWGLGVSRPVQLLGCRGPKVSPLPFQPHPPATSPPPTSPCRTRYHAPPPLWLTNVCSSLWVAVLGCFPTAPGICDARLADAAHGHHVRGGGFGVEIVPRKTARARAEDGCKVCLHIGAPGCRSHLQIRAWSAASPASSTTHVKVADVLVPCPSWAFV